MTRWEFTGDRWQRTTDPSGLHWHQLPEWVKVDILDQRSRRLQATAAIAIAGALAVIAATLIWWPI